ncbi:hypothetical protein Clacol_010015 [Clathrus columnatus]|uniref:Uncharacterized protein n=1 Tax=Clathrus columnatus TaxID=1419009 RepID=A0AAV5AM34_9AGAM|nr:hypothetical protein Clacol_010015 [Clathrus columnatus]
MHRIFTIGHVVSGIVSWMLPAELTTTVCVNDVWFEASIPLLWKEVRLKHALCVLGQVGNQPFKVPTPEKWERFQTYSKYVQILQAGERDSLALKIAMGSRPTTIPYLFPNCRFLTWDTMSDRGFLDFNALISPSLERFCLYTHDLERSFFHRICEQLKSSSPTLKCLQLDISISRPPNGRTEECEDLFHDLLTFFAPSLNAVQIPEVFRTESTMKKLYEIPKLCQLMIEVPGFFLCDEDVPLKKYAGYDGRGGFTSLENITFGGKQASLCNGLLHRFNLVSLQVLRWNLEKELSDVETFISIIVENCPQLHTLDVGDSRMYFNYEKPRPVVAWQVIRPLLRCQKLQRLSLHCFQVSLLNELRELLTNRVTWTCLKVYTEFPLRMTDLWLFAEHCPNLEELGVNINGFFQWGKIPNSDKIKISFPVLTSIDFAYSHFTPHMARSVASFLFEHCERPVQLLGWDMRFWDCVSITLCELYMVRAKRSRKPWSSEVLLFVERILNEVVLEQEMFVDDYGHFPLVNLSGPEGRLFATVAIRQILDYFSHHNNH